MVNPVHICSKVVEEMVEHARSDYPAECCGLLSGRGEVIDGIHPASNQKKSGQEFFVPVQELFDFFDEMRRTGRQHLGVYHSHPETEARPSSRDAAEFNYPEVSYWIVSLKNREPEVRCFLWEEDGFREVGFSAVGL